MNKACCVYATCYLVHEHFATSILMRESLLLALDPITAKVRASVCVCADAMVANFKVSLKFLTQCNKVI